MLKKRVLSVVLCLCMVASMLPSVISSAQASTNGHTRDEAVAWILDKEGTAIDYDGSFGAQCVDLIFMYYDYLGQFSRGYGKDYMNNSLPSGWERYTSSETTPQPGDIVVFDAGYYRTTIGWTQDDNGHVGLVYDADNSYYYFMDYQGWSQDNQLKNGQKRTAIINDFSCIIRPDWPSTGPSQPDPSDSSYDFDVATGTLTISGTGAASLREWTDQNGVSNDDIKSIIIENGITGIDDYAFAVCTGLVNVTIPDSVTFIGEAAFSGCCSLTSVSIPSSIMFIGDAAFSACTNLTQITVDSKNPNYIIEDGILFNRAKTKLLYCSMKKTGAYVIPDSVTCIGEKAFYACSGLTSISIPNGVTTISRYAFHSCSGLTNITIRGSVVAISHRAFEDCHGLTSVTILNGVTSIESYAFYGCIRLRSISIPSSITLIEDSAFLFDSNLSDIYYDGGEGDWLSIVIEYRNDPLHNCSIHFNSIGPVNVKETIQQLAGQALKNVLGVASIRCPVDVEISTNGQSVGQIVNNVASGVDEGKIYVHVENDEKYIYFLTSEEFTINLTATGTGTMEYSVQNLDVPSWTTVDEKYFRKVELTPSKKMVSDIDYLDTDTELVDTPNVQLYVLGGDDNSTPVKKVLPDNKGTEAPLNTPVITFDTAVDSISILPMAVGDDGILSELPMPTRSGYTFNGWYMPDGTKVDTNTVFTADTTIKAQWTKNSTGGDSPSNPGGSTTTPTVPGGPGYNPGGIYTPPTHSITIPSVTGGKVSVNPSSASSGSTITVTVTPDAGYELASLTVSDSTGKTLELTVKGNGQYSFKMPNGKVSLSAEFRLVSTNTPWNNPFLDISIGDWYYDAVRFVSENGLMNGVGNGYFSPNTNLSRAMFAQILYNKAGQPSAVGSSAFNDVSIGAWHADAVAWAAVNNVVGGYGDGTFGPGNPITREQLAVMLWRYEGKPVPPDLLLNFTDADHISDYALDALCWAVDQGVINGKGNGILDPKGFATRAEVAQVLVNYLGK